MVLFQEWVSVWTRVYSSWILQSFPWNYSADFYWFTTHRFQSFYHIMLLYFIPIVKVHHLCKVFILSAVKITRIFKIPLMFVISLVTCGVTKHAADKNVPICTAISQTCVSFKYYCTPKQHTVVSYIFPSFKCRCLTADRMFSDYSSACRRHQTSHRRVSPMATFMADGWQDARCLVSNAYFTWPINCSGALWKEMH